VDRNIEGTAESEASLVGRVATGDRRAFETLYRMYFPRLARFLHRMTRSVPLIEEIVNDTMLVVWQKAATSTAAARCRPGCSRSRTARPARPCTPSTSRWNRSPTPAWRTSRPARLALRTAAPRHAVDAALAALPLEQRAAFQLTFYHDMGYAEIAEIMECPVNTVKTRLFHARRRLATLLEDQLEVRP
jgi:DNA-directed RNA polymerase specialized sigma24 family protein